MFETLITFTNKLRASMWDILCERYSVRSYLCLEETVPLAVSQPETTVGMLGQTFNTIFPHFWCLCQPWVTFSALFKWFNFTIYWQITLSFRSKCVWFRGDEIMKRVSPITKCSIRKQFDERTVSIERERERSTGREEIVGRGNHLQLLSYCKWG